MTRPSLWPTVFLLLLSASPATAIEIEVPLPGLLGVYPEMQKRTVAFQLVDTPDVVHSASLRLSGVVGGCGMFFGANMGADLSQPGCLVYADFGMEDGLGGGITGAFTSTAEFHIFVEPCWDFLMDGNGEVDLTAYVASGLCDPIAVTPTAQITEAVLIIDGEFPIRAQPSTWGKVKALYR